MIGYNTKGKGEAWMGNPSEYIIVLMININQIYRSMGGDKTGKYIWTTSRPFPEGSGKNNMMARTQPYEDVTLKGYPGIHFVFIDS